MKFFNTMKQTIFFSIILSFLSFIIDNQEVLAVENIDVSISPRVVNGAGVGIVSHPYQASLRRSDDFFCAATSVKGDGMLTAGHCFTHVRNVMWPYLDVGAHMATDNLHEPGDLYRIRRVIIHPGWTGIGIKLHDLAYIHLEKNITISDYSNTIRLPNRHIVNQRWGWFTSWGSHLPDYPIVSEMLRRTRMTVITYMECQRRMPPNLVLQKGQLCGYQERGGGMSHGDDGGPIVIYDRIIAIYSWTARNCRVDAPGPAQIFVDLFVERDFIDKAMREEL